MNAKIAGRGSQGYNFLKRNQQKLATPVMELSEEQTNELKKKLESAAALMPKELIPS